MKKSSPGSRPRVTRITPSAPTPRWRSHRAAASSTERGRSSAMSSSRTKSLPVPWYFQMRIGSAIQVPHQPIRELARTVGARAEPTDPRVPAEPHHLTARELLRPPHRALHRLGERDLASQVAGELSVPDGLGRGEPCAETVPHQRGDLVEQAVLEHRVHPAPDP